jgi:hypothetical protein
VGTDLFEVAISGLYGAASYSYKGRAELLAAIIMLLGASIGAQIGSVATKYVKGYGIRIFFGIAVIGCGFSILLKIVGAGVPRLRPFADTGATVLILGLVATLAVYIFIKFVTGVREERASLKQAERAHAAHA